MQASPLRADKDSPNRGAVLCFGVFPLVNACHSNQSIFMFGKKDRPGFIGCQAVFPKTHWMVDVNGVIYREGDRAILDSVQAQRAKFISIRDRCCANNDRTAFRLKIYRLHVKRASALSNNPGAEV